MVDFMVVPTKGIVETFEFWTDIQVALSGKESRVAKRAAPRLSYLLNYSFAEGLHSKDYEKFLAARSASTVRVPLACHLVEKWNFPAGFGTEFNGQTTAGAGMNYVLWNSDGTYSIVPFSATTLNNNSTYYAGAPVAEAIPDIQHSYSIQTPNLIQAQLKFQLKNFVEKMPTTPWFTPAGVLTSSGTWDFLNNAAQGKTSISTTDAIDVLDAGNVPYVHPVKRFSKTKINVNLTLTSRLEILKFRNFIYTLKGSCNAFLLKHSEFNAEDGQLARLASDVVEINYLTPAIANVTLELVLVDE